MEPVVQQNPCLSIKLSRTNCQSRESQVRHLWECWGLPYCLLLLYESVPKLFAHAYSFYSLATAQPALMLQLAGYALGLTGVLNSIQKRSADGAERAMYNKQIGFQRNSKTPLQLLLCWQHG